MSKTQIGSFRLGVDMKKHLPAKLFTDLFDEALVTSNEASKISVDRGAKKVAFLNNGAFGRAYDLVQSIAIQLRQFAESNPDIFYDQVCLDLVRHSSRVTCNFFGTENVVLVPNCSIGMKSILESLVKNDKNLVAAYLSPVYGATQKLLQCFKNEELIKDIIAIAPGGESNALTEEDAQLIVCELAESYKCRKFDILFADETSSQSGRILPLQAVATFCRKNGVTLIVDGTQSCQLLFDKNKVETLDQVDYFIMSTHKWIGNIKTCGIIRFGEKALPPNPPAISFGWDYPATGQPEPSIEETQSRFLWIGMLDSYISYITLGKAIQIFSHHGEAQAKKSSRLLNQGLRTLLKVDPLLPDSEDKVRTMNIFKLENSQFEPLADVTRIQNALQDYGVYVSVKKFGRDCGSSNINAICSRKEKFYLRVSSWSFNNVSDFEALALTLTNNLRISATTNEALRNQFTYIYDLYDKLFSVLKPEAFFIRAERLRHHLIFYFGHTSVFYINKLIVSGHLADRIDPRLEATLSVGVDEMSWDDLLEDNYDWSGLSDIQRIKFFEKVKNYRQKVRKLVLNLIDRHPVKQPISSESLHRILIMGMEHEKIHLETSAVIIAQVPLDLIKSCHDFNFPTFFDNNKQLQTDQQGPESAPENQLIPVPGGTVCMGKDFLEQDLFGWDNEFGHEKRVLEDFEASQMLVSNAEYLEFVLDGGYAEAGKCWWSQEGWKYVTEMQVTGPRFWIGKTHYRFLLKEVPMPWDFPVEVNNLEAEAFCNWKSSKLGKQLRLISHEESFHMRSLAENETNNNNLNKFASPTPVNHFGGEIQGKKIFDISGNLWQHSVSVLTVMDGFKVDPFYDDFTLPTIDGFHSHILGGSWISIGNCANLNARYGFRRHFYQFCGIRYVHSNNDYHKRVPKLFDGVLIGKHITEHYGEFTEDIIVEEKPVRNWPEQFGVKAAEILKMECQQFRNGENIKVMVVHGSVGRTTLELLRKCKNLSIDHTGRTANHLQVLESLLSDSKIQWYQQLEGVIVEPMEFLLDESEANCKLLQPKGNSVSFWQADYKNMRPMLNGYDVIVADFRYKNSADHLSHIAKRLKPGGLLILGSIDDVNQEEQEPKHILKALRRNFEKIEQRSVTSKKFAHIYRQTRNKCQYAISNLSVWRKLLMEKDMKLYDTPVEDLQEVAQSTADYYEDENILDSYDQFHFGEGLLSVKNFPLRMAEICIAAVKRFNINKNAALDAGCGPGRTALELSSVFNHVEAYDYSQGFVDMLLSEMTDCGIKNLSAYQGDSHKQEEICRIKKYDLIHGSNLIDRLHSPEQWVLQSKSMLNPGGLLVISSPYTWMEEHTPLENWIGGYKKNGENYFTVDGLKELLKPELALLEVHRIPFVIPDADGTFQYTYSNCTIFGSKNLVEKSRDFLHPESQG